MSLTYHHHSQSAGKVAASIQNEDCPQSCGVSAFSCEVRKYDLNTIYAAGRDISVFQHRLPVRQFHLLGPLLSRVLHHPQASSLSEPQERKDLSQTRLKPDRVGQYHQCCLSHLEQV
jgi:hypothetical protein